MSLPPTNKSSDSALLKRFARVYDEEAFAALVERYAGLVYGVALRRAGGSMADEVVQNVFGILARKAGTLDATHGLAAWLHKVAGREAANVARKEQRREHAMERYAESLNEDPSPPDPELVSALDEALLSLGDAERQVILLRFFDSLSLRDIGQRLGATEEAARKRVSRALDKLSTAYQLRTSRTVPVATLTTLLGASLNTKAPAAVIAAATAAAPTATSAAAFFTIMKTSQAAFVSTLVLAAAIPVAVQWQASAVSQPSAATAAAIEQPATPAGGSGEPVHGLRVQALHDNRDQLDLGKLAAALAQIDKDGEPKALMNQLLGQMYALRERDLATVGELLANSPNAKHLRALITAYFSRWAEFDALAALEATKVEPWTELGSSGRIAAAQVWATRDPDAAVAWCEAQGPDIHGSILKMCVFREWGIADPQAALAKTRELPTDRGLSYRKELISNWVHHDAEGAMQWAQAIDDETERNVMIEKVLEERSQQNAASGFAMAAELEDPVLRADCLYYALMQWRFQPADSVRGYLSLPEADRGEELADSVRSWIKLEPQPGGDGSEAQLRAWLATQEEGQP